MSFICDSTNIDNLTVGQIKNLLRLLSVEVPAEHANYHTEGTGSFMIGQKVIIRTYAAGVHFGTLNAKAGREVILGNARRLWKWHAADGVCTHGVARYGIIAEGSIVCAPVTSVWLEAIEIIPCSELAAHSIEEAEYAHPAKGD